MAIQFREAIGKKRGASVTVHSASISSTCRIWTRRWDDRPAGGWAARGNRTIEHIGDVRGAGAVQALNYTPAMTPRPAPEFSENFQTWVSRQVLGLAFAVMPKRALAAPAFAFATAYRLIFPGPRIPNKTSIWRTPDGYGGPVHDASPEGILAGMRAGFFQISHVGPLKWWSPSQRSVMMLKDVHVPRRFRRSMRTLPFTVSFDKAFPEILVACAVPRQRIHLTWLFPKMQRLMQSLFDLGHAHSVEVWDERGDLVGGLFGVSLGPVFSALSMFHTANDGSKLALISLYHHLDAWGVKVVDHQVSRPWAEKLGAQLIARAHYTELLKLPSPKAAQPGRWTEQFTVAQTADWQPVRRDSGEDG